MSYTLFDALAEKMDFQQSHTQLCCVEPTVSDSFVNLMEKTMSVLNCEGQHMCQC